MASSCPPCSASGLVRGVAIQLLDENGDRASTPLGLTDREDTMLPMIGIVVSFRGRRAVPQAEPSAAMSGDAVVARGCE